MTKQDEIVTELLPCPFCGGEAELSDLGDPRDDSFISCSKCGVQQIANYTPELAAARWNTRTATRSADQERGDDDALAKLIELADDSRYSSEFIGIFVRNNRDRLQPKAPETGEG